MDKIGPINDAAERRHYSLKPCCYNCVHKRNESPKWPFKMHWCVKKKKHLGHDLKYDTKCKAFSAIMTPEENKMFWLRFKELIYGNINYIFLNYKKII